MNKIMSHANMYIRKYITSKFMINGLKVDVFIVASTDIKRLNPCSSDSGC